MKAIKDNLVVLVPQTTHKVFDLYRDARDQGILLDLAKKENLQVYTFDEFEKVFNNNNDIQYDNFILFVDTCLEKPLTKDYRAKSVERNLKRLEETVNGITDNLSCLIQTVDDSDINQVLDSENKDEIVEDTQTADFVEGALHFLISADKLLDNISYKMFI